MLRRSYDAWGEASPDRLEILPVKTVTISQNKWAGSQEIVTVDTTIPVIEQPIPERPVALPVGEDDNDEEEEGEPEVVYAEGTVGDMFKMYDIQPPKGGTYKPEDYYVDKPVFEPMAKPKVKEEHLELFYRVMHSKVKDPAAMDWTVNDPSVDSPEKGDFESEFAYRMKAWAQQLNHGIIAAKFGLEPQVWGEPKERKPDEHFDPDSKQGPLRVMRRTAFRYTFLSFLCIVASEGHFPALLGFSVRKSEKMWDLPLISAIFRLKVRNCGEIRALLGGQPPHVLNDASSECISIVGMFAGKGLCIAMQCSSRPSRSLEALRAKKTSSLRQSRIGPGLGLPANVALRPPLSNYS